MTSRKKKKNNQLDEICDCGLDCMSNAIRSKEM